MAKVVGGFASSHTPLLATPGELWGEKGESDKHSPQLVMMPEGKRVDYEELLANADPNIMKQINVETYVRKYESLQKGLDELDKRFGETDMDVVVMLANDQGEFFYDDITPMIAVYWGETMRLVPAPLSDDMLPGARSAALARSGTEEREWPVNSALGLHIIESLIEEDFDVAQYRYLRDEYGGSYGPSTWYLDHKQTKKMRRQGMPHAYSIPIMRWFNGKEVPIVPISMNTIYPPNWISPRRAFMLGQAVRRAVDNWKSDVKVAFACSGGLSHWVVDEELDRLALKGMEEANGEILTSLPRHRLQAATSETLNWVATQGAMGTRMETITYEPAYRTPAGTGVGCAVGHWDAK